MKCQSIKEGFILDNEIRKRLAHNWDFEGNKELEE